jgi:hypothetical protein
MIRDDLKESDENYDHFLNHNTDLLFNYINQYYLAEKNYIVCVCPHVFEFNDPSLGKFFDCSLTLRITDGLD